MSFLCNRYKSLNYMFLLILCTILFACGDGGGGSSSSGGSGGSPAVESSPTLTLSSFSASSILVGESATITVSALNLTSSTPTVVAVNNNNTAVISITPTNCSLTASVNSCVVTVTGIAPGSANITISATGMTSVTSGTLTVNSTVATGVLFGTVGGLVFNNSTLLAGGSALGSIFNSQVQGTVVDSTGNIYSAGGGTGKIFKYNVTAGYWQAVPGSGAGGSLDGSGITVLRIDTSNNLYAGTNAGNVFKYTNGVWALMGTLLNDPIQSLVIDSSNNVYAGTQNAGIVYKFVSGSWVSLGQPEVNFAVLSIAITSSGNIYASTSGTVADNANGQVYLHAGGTTWTAKSTFTEGPINALAVNGTDLYAGTTGTVLGAASGKVKKYSGTGTAWSDVGTIPINNGGITVLTINNTDIYAGTYGSSYNGQVYRYNGTTWSQISSLNNGGLSAIFIRNNVIYVGLANSGSSSGLAYVYNSNVWVAIGGGALDGAPILSTTVDSSTNLYAATQNNVFKYASGSSSWVLFGNLFALDQSGVATMVTNNKIIYAGTNGGNVYRSNIVTGNWALLTTFVNSSISSLAVSGSGQLFASINDTGGPNNGTVWKYDTTTSTWINLPGTGAANSLDGSTIQSITFDATGNLYAATAGTGAGGFVWEYPVGGTAWVITGLGSLDGSQINSLTTDANSNVYAGTNGPNNGVTNTGNVFKFNGSYWAQLGSGSLDGTPVTNVVIGNSGNLYATTNGGQIWVYMVSSNLWANTYYSPGVPINTPASSGY